MQRVFKENDIVWRKMPFNGDVSYYRVTEYIQKQDRLSAISLLTGIEGIIEAKDLHHYWLQIGDMFAYRNQESIVVVDMRMNSWGLRDIVLDVIYPSGNSGTITISEEFRQNINFV